MNDNNPTEAPLHSIDGAWLRDALVAGIHRVISRRDYINKINVFPVADADTGTNLAFTLNAVLTGASRKASENVGRFLTDVADLALDGARGNSGAIFAQYLQGFSEVVEDHATLSAPLYAQAALGGAQSAQGAIAEPRDGTMLSVIRDYALSLQEQVTAGVDDFRDLFKRGLARAQESLANTPNQLEVLRQNGVVDAGAQGFVDLLEGIQGFIDSGFKRVEPVALNLDDDLDLEPAAGSDGVPDHRFCTECVVTGAEIDRRKLKEHIQDLDASSLVIAGTRNKVRVHVHVNNPASVFLVCEDFGVVSSQKADDMRAQQHSSHGPAQKVAVVADTGADLPDEEMERLRINLVPLRVNFGDRQFLDKVSISPDEFYHRVRTSPVPAKTSQPPPGDYRRQFEFLRSHHDSVVCVSVSSALSGTWQAAASAAGRVDPDRIVAWDSLNASTGEGLLTLYAAEAAQKGLDRDQVLAVLDHMRPRTRTFAVIRDLSHAVRGGRVPGWVKRVAAWLRLTVIIASNPEGRVVPRGALLTRGSLPERFARWMSRRIPGGAAYRLLIGHCNAPEDARILRRELVARLPMIQSVLTTDVGTAIGAHAGPGSLVVGVQEYVSPEDWLARNGEKGKGA